MKKLLLTTKYKKDVKRHSNLQTEMEELARVIDMLVKEIPLPRKYKAHKMKNQYKGCFECHVGNDFLLIWDDGECILLIRLGSHSELFG